MQKKTVLNGLGALMAPMGMYAAAATASAGTYMPRTYLRTAQGIPDTAAQLPSLSSLPRTAGEFLINQPILSADFLQVEQGQPLRELVLVDAGVPQSEWFDYATRPDTEVVHLSDGSGRLQQIIDVLSAYRDLTAIHLISHGQAGALILGNERVDEATLEDNPDFLAAFEGATRPGADLLLYGCDVAAGDDSILDIIRRETHLDVAASSSPTGNAGLGGDWVLEVVRGDIETTLPFSEKALRDFSGVLGSFSPRNFCNDSNGGRYRSNINTITSENGDFTVTTSPSAFHCGYSGQLGYLNPIQPSHAIYLASNSGGVEFSSLVLGGGCSVVDVAGYSGGAPVATSLNNTPETMSSNTINLSTFSGKNVDSLALYLSSCSGATGISSFSTVEPNTAPTDIALGSASINQSSTGAGAVIGSLSTTDADSGDNHNYSLVSNGASSNGSCGASGDDDNASFQVDNANDDLETAGSLASGSYDVCIETSDGTASYQESFAITVNDNVAPSYQNGTPSVSGTTANQTTLTTRLDEAGVTYWVALSDGAAAPLAVNVRNGTDRLGNPAPFSGSYNVSSNGVDFTDDITGLSAGTSYDLWVVSEDGVPNLGSPTKIDVTTLRDSDGSLITAAGVAEPVALFTTVDTVAETVNVFDFTLADGGTSDNLPLNVTEITLNVSGSSSDTERSKITWRLNGPDVSNVTGTYNGGSDTITFSSLGVSVAHGASETYTVNAYYNDNTGLTEDRTVILSVDGDTDLTVGGSGTQMGSTSTVTNGTGTAIEVVASQLAFATQPSGSVSGSALTTQPVVVARDAFGNIDADFTETITLVEASAGSMSNNTQASVNGVATFTGLTYSATADQQSFTLTADDQAGVGSDLPTVDANAVTSDVVATKLIFDNQPAPTTLTSGVATAFTTVPVISAVDGNNVPDTGYSTDITLAEVNGAGSASLTGTGDTDGNGSTVTLTPSSGTATFTGFQATYTASGSSDETFNLRASSGALTAADSSQLTASVTPTINSVSVPSNGTYATGQNLDFTVNTSQPMTVNTASGTPRLSLTIGGSVVYASYISGSGTSALTFRYTLQAGDLDADGISVGALEANGGTLQDGAGNDLDTTLNSVGSTGSVLVDAVAPTVSSVSVPSNDLYVAGENLDFTVNTSENVTVNTAGGTPRIPLTVGSTTRYASYLSGSGTSALAFRYAVQSGDEDADGVAVSAVVDLNGGTLQDSAGNDLNTTLNSLGNTSSVLVDAVAPSGYSVSFDDSTLNASESDSVSFTFAGAEVGADYSYSISSNGGGTPVTGTGTVSDGAQQITGLDVGNLGDGTLTLSVALTDEAGNQSSSVTTTATLDATAASVTLDSAADPVTHAEFTVSITFDEPVNGFAVGDITVSNATVGSFSGSGASYTATITPTDDGTVTVDVGAGVAQDAAGNDSTAATQLSRVYDGTAPVPVITTDVTADVTNAPIGVTVDFGETVTGFVSGDLSVNNGSVTGFTDSGNGLFELTVEAAGDGDVTIELLAGVAEDEAGNASEASDPLILAFDGSVPVLQSSVPAAGASDVPYQSDLSLTFDEPVFAGVGELVVQDATDGVEHTRLVITDTQVSIDDAQVTIALDEVLVPTHEYYVTFAANSLEDAAGNGWAGIVGDTAFRFTVGNQAPEADNDSANLDQGARLALDVLANDRDEEGRLNLASVRVVAQPTHGRVSVETGTGAVTYEPETDYTGPDSFTYVVEDEFGGQSNAATVSLIVEPAGLPPVTRGDVATVVPGGTVTLAPLDNDYAGTSGVSLDPQSAELILRPHHGTAQWADGKLTYTAESDFEGVESLAYTVSDANGVRSAVTRLYINVADGAIAPLARDDSADTEMAAEIAVNVLTNDEATGSALASGTVELGSLPRHGVAEVDPATGAIAYMPDADFRGEDAFHYTVRDDRGLVSESALVTINVGLAGVPVAGNDQVQAMDGATIAINVLGNDRGLGLALSPATLSVVDSPAQGLVTLDTGAGVFRYTPNDTFDGSDTFTYTVQDEDGQVSGPATVTVTDQPGNNRPLANDRDVTVAEDNDTSLSPLTNDQDLNGTLDTASLQVEQQPLNGTLSVGAGGTVSYTPGENFYGEDRFTYTVADDFGRRSRLAVVRLVVAPVPDQPQISGSPTSTVSAGNAYRFTPVVTDTDGNPLTFSVVNLPAWATFDEQNGRVSGTPELDDVGRYGGIVISVSNGDESSELAAFSVRVTGNSGGSDDGGQGSPESPVTPGSDEGADIPVVDSDNPVVEVGNDKWPSYTDDQPSKALYETTFVDAAGGKRSVSVLVDDPQAPLPATESPDASGRQTLTFSQSDGSEQTVAVSPSGETTIAVFGQAGDADPVSKLTSDAAELIVTALAGGDMLSKVVIENSDGGSSEMTIVQSVMERVLVSGTRYSADGAVLETTAVQFDMVPADIELAADGTVSLRGEATSGSETTAVEYRVTPAGTVSAVSQYADGIITPVSSGATVRQGGSVGMVMVDGYIALDQPYPNAGVEHMARVASNGQVEYIDGSANTTNLPAGSILIIDGDQATTGGRDLDPDGNELNRAGEILGAASGQPIISRLEVTDLSNGNESVFVSPAVNGDGINASRSLPGGELSARIRLDGTSVHRLSGRVDMRDNQARSLIPGSLSLFFNDRVVTVVDETDTTLLTELLGNGEVRHEVAAGGASTRAFSYLPGSSTVMERDDDGDARVVTRASANGRSLEATASADGSANHRLINRLGERSEADIRVPGAFTSLNEDGNLRSRVRLDGSDVCAWVETFGNGEAGTGFGTYDPDTLTCQSVEMPTSRESLFEAGNTVEVESESGKHTITIETRVTRPIRF
jgi:hypothetical protein